MLVASVLCLDHFQALLAPWRSKHLIQGLQVLVCLLYTSDAADE